LKKVPGKEAKFDLKVMADYLTWRANRNKKESIAGIKSKLKHVGLCYDFLLPTAKTDGPGAKMRIQLAKVTKELSKKRKKKLKAKGKSQSTKRALALGKIAVGLLFSAYGAATERGFRRASEVARHWLTICVSMHSGCMRNKLMQELWNKGSARWSQIEGLFRMAADWRKMKHGGPFTVPFPGKPKLEPMIYPAFDEKGNKIDSFTAADVLRWQIDIEGSNMCKHIWAPTGRKRPTRAALQQFIRDSFAALLTANKDEVDALVKAMTPHSWRAGMAGDLDRAGHPITVNMRVGRWFSERATKLYIRDGLAQWLQEISFKRIRTESVQTTRKSRATMVRRMTSSSEGYGASDATDESSEQKFPPTDPGTPPHYP
jgi:hypothetical protein